MLTVLLAGRYPCIQPGRYPASQEDILLFGHIQCAYTILTNPSCMVSWSKHSCISPRRRVAATLHPWRLLTLAVGHCSQDWVCPARLHECGGESTCYMKRWVLEIKAADPGSGPLQSEWTSPGLSVRCVVNNAINKRSENAHAACNSRAEQWGRNVGWSKHAHAFI